MLDDLFSLIAAGKAKTSEGLRLLSAYKAEDSYIVWNNISSHLSQLATVISDQDCYVDFDRSKVHKSTSPSSLLSVLILYSPGLFWTYSASERQ